MAKDDILARYLAALLQGDRAACRCVIEEALQSGIPVNSVYADVIWPIMIEIEGLLRCQRITPVQEHLATRVNRSIVDQLQSKLPRRPRKGKKIVVCCGPDELHELGGQMMADLFESDGWEVKFVGGRLTNDDMLGFINESGPDIVLIYGATAKQAPDIRLLIDAVKGINAWPEMRVMVSGGVFSRADGLWQEIGADLFAETALDAIGIASSDRKAQVEDDGQRTNQRRRRKKRVRRHAVAEVV
jgi:methanogenic corrinoid protein MtbC1